VGLFTVKLVASSADQIVVPNRVGVVVLLNIVTGNYNKTVAQFASKGMDMILCVAPKIDG
jgi:hypothetical protein